MINRQKILKYSLMLAVGIALALIFMRIQVEWSWFSQFKLERIIIRRWAYQAFSSLGAIFIALSFILWQRKWKRISNKTSLNTINDLKGWSYGTSLFLSLSLLVASVIFLRLEKGC